MKSLLYPLIEMFKNNDKQETLDSNTPLFEVLEGIFNSNEYEDANMKRIDPLQKELASESLMDGDYYYVIDHLEQYFLEVFKNQATEGVETFRGLKFMNIQGETKGDDKKPIIDCIIDQIEKGQIFLSELELNDAMDPLILYLSKNQKFNNGKVGMLWKKFLIKIIGNFKIASLIKYDESAIKNLLMWAHYTNSHTGICIDYSLFPENFYYSDKGFCYIGDIKYSNRKITPLDITLQDAFLLKCR